MKFLGWCIIVTAWITILTATFARSQHTFQEFELREQLQQQQVEEQELRKFQMMVVIGNQMDTVFHKIEVEVQ